LTPTELSDGKRQLQGQIMLALENPLSRMGRLAGSELHEEGYRPLDDVLAQIDAVSHEQVAGVAAEFFAPERQTVVRLGPS
jgi:predicted Zn-dependent peptidase